MTVEALLGEFHARLRAGNRKQALELLEPELPAGDLHVVLAYATTKIEDGDGLAAVILLKQNERHSGNSHYALLAGVAARSLISQVTEWGEHAERRLLDFAESHSEQEGVPPQLQRYLHLCWSCGLRARPQIRSALGRFGLDEPDDDPIKATFQGYRDGRPSNQTKTLLLPAAPQFLEADTIDWRPRVNQQSHIDVDEQDFKVYRDVRLYMLPFMYGLIETEEGSFLGDVVGGINPHGQRILTARGKHFYKNLADPLLKKHPERRLSGTRLLPFRLAGTYYFHFATETLQTIYEARRELRSIPFVLPQSPGFFDRIPRQVHDSAIETIRAGSQTCQRLDDGIYRLDEVVVPTRIKYANTTYQNNVMDVLGVGGNSDTHTSDIHARILYIARRQGMIRAVTNEETLVTRLAERFPSFRRIYLEDMSYANQIVAFRNATLIIAPHGGGLTNMIFCRPGTGVIEFHLHNTPIMYWHLSATQRLRYLAYLPEAHDPNTLNYVIEPDALIAAVEAIAQATPFDPNNLPPV